MTTYRTPQRSTFWQKLGPGGFASLALALAGGLLTLGLPVWLCRRKVLQAAAGQPLRRADAILVLGRRLADDQITSVFRQRLEHAASLWLLGMAPRVIVTGGLTGDATRTEAEAGREWLEAQGVPEEDIRTEDRSQHTLENLFNVREHLRVEGWTTLVLVSDPLHLARALAMAQGLGLDATGSPAQSCPPLRGTFGWWRRSLKEAFLLHWYLTGMAYSRLIRSEKQLARVT